MEAPNFGHAPWTRDRVKLLQSPYFFPPAVPSTTPTHRHFVLSPVSLALRDNIYLYDRAEN